MPWKVTIKHESDLLYTLELDRFPAAHKVQQLLQGQLEEYDEGWYMASVSNGEDTYRYAFDLAGDVLTMYRMEPVNKTTIDVFPEDED